MLEFFAIAVLIPLAANLWSNQIQAWVASYRKSCAASRVTLSQMSLSPVVRIVLTPTEGRLEILTSGENREADVEALIYAQNQLRDFLAKPYDRAVVDALHVFTEAMGGKVKLIVGNPQ